MTTYRTSDGDMADEIAFKHYGTTDGRVVEQLLEANPGLSDIGPVLPAGLVITLPDIDTTAKQEGLRLWT
jgi:phage tail protein X